MDYEAYYRELAKVATFEREWTMKDKAFNAIDQGACDLFNDPFDLLIRTVMRVAGFGLQLAFFVTDGRWTPWGSEGYDRSK